MGQRATDSNFELVEDTTVTLGASSNILQISNTFTLLNEGGSNGKAETQIAAVEDRFDSIGYHAADPSLYIWRMKLLNSDLTTTASNLAECVEAINSMGSTLKQIMNDQDPGYSPTIFVGFDQKMYDNPNNRPCIWGYLPGPGDTCPVAGDTVSMGFAPTTALSPCGGEVTNSQDAKVHPWVKTSSPITVIQHLVR